ncbi:hypothetical protein [Empedobacter stercoris]|uniref:hypothetical protein n=1 Tax=Empedobacter stercoris TaxID=1628248 RepID=UPI0039E73933
MNDFKTAILAVVKDLVSAEDVNINKAIFTEVFGVSDLTSTHTFVGGVRQGSVIPIINNDADYGAYSKADARACTMNNATITEDYATKVWDLVELNGRHAICVKSLEENFLLFWGSRKATLEDPTAEPDYNDYLDFLTEKVVKNMKASTWRQAYLGDKAHLSDLVNGADGFIAQAEAMNGEKVTLTGETGQDIYDSLKTAYEAISLKAWFDESQVVIKMTKTMAQTLVNFLNSLADASEYNVAVLNPNAVVASRKFTVAGLYIFGIKVEAHLEIDRSMDAIAEVDKMKAIITRKSNLLVGAPKVDSLDQFRMFYDNKDNQIYIDVATYFGVAIVTDEYALISK